jgi:hypothetical protein
LFTSELLTSVWGLGHASVGDLTFESAAYVARYVMKKVNGSLKQSHYEVIDYDTGEVVGHILHLFTYRYQYEICVY